MFSMVSRSVFILIFLASTCSAGIIENVRSSLAQGNFAAADAYLETYRTERGADPSYLEALSWMARASLAVKDLAQATTYAKQTERLCLQQLRRKPLDTDPHLPIALGAALEVEAQVLNARGKRAEAATFLQEKLKAYGTTSIAARLQKNLNLLSLNGQPAPALTSGENLGPKSASLAQFRGSPVLLFFWAHWCSDCKAEGPIIARLRSEFSSRGLKVVAPTQLYGYAAQGADASPKDELAYIQRVWKTYYPDLQDVPVPVGKSNFNTYGASTTPTLVLLGRDGRVALYHPGAMPYADLRASVEKVAASVPGH